MRRLAPRAVMWATVALPLGVLGWLVCVDSFLKAGFRRLDAGQSREQVESILGKPSDIEECGHFGGKVGREIPSNCVYEYSYVSLLSFTDLWAVGFDDTERVVWTYRYRSP